MTEELVQSNQREVITIGEETNLDFRTDEEMQVFLDQVERRNTAIERMMQMALKKLLPTDFHDMDGKPFLQGVGAQRLMKYFGVSVRNVIRTPEIGYEVVDDGDSVRWRVTFRAEFSLGAMSVVGEGIRDTHNKLFGRKDGDYKTIKDIELPDLDRSAKTAMYRDGVSTLLGLKSLTWDYLESLGFSKDNTTGHKFQTGTKGGNASSSADTKTKQTEIANMIFEMSGNDPEKSQAMLKKYSEFKTKDGKIVEGVESSLKLSDKRTEVVHGKVMKDFEDWKESAAAMPHDDLQDELGF